MAANGPTGERPASTRLAPTAGAWSAGAQAAGWREDRCWLVPLLVLFVLKGVLLVAMVGPFTGHDEVDHFFYVARLAAGDGLGVVGEVDLPAVAEPYRRYVADYPTNAEVIHPPLYHALLAPLYLVAPGGPVAKLFLLRLVSVPLGAAVVWLAYRSARLLFPDDLLLRAGVPVFVAFQPQFAFEAAIVNHDVLLIGLVSAVVLLCLGGLRDGFDRRRQWMLGLAGAAGLWTKASFGLVLPVVALAVLLRWWSRDRAGCRREDLGGLLWALARTVGLPPLLAAPWFLRSLVLYGDPTGAARLREVSDFGNRAQTYWGMLSSGPFWRQMVQDFWGNYGWRQVPLDPGLFRVVWVVWAAAAAGLAVGAARAAMRRRAGRGAPRWSRVQRRGVAVLACLVAAMVFGVLYVGTIQFTQARFAFPAMIGWATLTLLGVAGWLPARGAARPAALPVLVALLMVLQVVVAVRFLLPFYYGPGGGAAAP